MQQQIGRRHFHNAHEIRRFTLLWLTILLWAVFLVYMILFHWLREIVEPMLMSHFDIMNIASYPFVEAQLFIYLLWACCSVSVLAIMNTWGKKHRAGDNTPDKFLVVIMAITVSFAFYYAYCDLDCLDGRLSLLADFFNRLLAN